MEEEKPKGTKENKSKPPPKPQRSLSDEEYEAIFKAVLARSPSPAQSDTEDFETIVEDDFVSDYVEAFVRNSQKEKLKKHEEENGKVLSSADKGNNANELEEEESEDKKAVNLQASKKEKEESDNEDKEAVTLSPKDLQEDLDEANTIAESEGIENTEVERNSKSDTNVEKEQRSKEGKSSEKKKFVIKKKKITREDLPKKQKNEKSPKLTSLAEVYSPKFSGPKKTEKRVHSKSAKGLHKKKKMTEREIKENGIWVQCMASSCMKWRYLENVYDPTCLPDKWVCSMNPDENYSSCDKVEQSWDEEEHCQDYFFLDYTEGSIVWARMAGYPWWPGMIEIDPDQEIFFHCHDSKKNVATSYHVVFFDDKVSRAWIRSKCIKPFNKEKSMSNTTVKGQNYKKAIESASKTARAGLDLAIKERLQTYGFAARYKGRWGYDVFPDSQGPSTSKSRKERGRKNKMEAELELLREFGISKKTASYWLKNQEEIARKRDSFIERICSSAENSQSDNETFKLDENSDSEYETKKEKRKREVLESDEDEDVTVQKKQRKEKNKKNENKHEKKENLKKSKRDEEEHSKNKENVKKSKKKKFKMSSSEEEIEKEQSKVLKEVNNEKHPDSKSPQEKTNQKKKEKIQSKTTKEVNKEKTGESKSSSDKAKEEKKKPSFPVPPKKKFTFGAPVKKSLSEVVKAGTDRENKGKQAIGKKENIEEKEENKNKLKSDVFDSDIFTMDTSENLSQHQLDEDDAKEKNKKEKDSNCDQFDEGNKIKYTDESMNDNNVEKSTLDEDCCSENDFQFEQSQMMNDIIKGIDVSAPKDQHQLETIEEASEASGSPRSSTSNAANPSPEATSPASASASDAVVPSPEAANLNFEDGDDEEDTFKTLLGVNDEQAKITTPEMNSSKVVLENSLADNPQSTANNNNDDSDFDFDE